MAQRPRAQSRAHVLDAAAAAAFVIFPTRERPQLGKRGDYQARMRRRRQHVMTSFGTALGVIFHDARETSCDLA